jgi:hypothetical protein
MDICSEQSEYSSSCEPRSRARTDGVEVRTCLLWSTTFGVGRVGRCAAERSAGLACWCGEVDGAWDELESSL